MLQIPRKQVVEKASRALEREAIEMDKKNRTYTLLEDSESDGDAGVEKPKRKSKIKDKTTKRRHIRQKKDSSSEDESPKRYFASFYGLHCCLHCNNSFIHLLSIPPSSCTQLEGSYIAYSSCYRAKTVH